jgi:hypothetical protein
MAASPTQRSLDALRKAAYLPAVVERFLPGVGIRQDLYGFLDIVAIRADRPGVLGVQTTTLHNARARYLKLIAIPASRVWLLARNRIEVHGWAKVAGRWECVRREVTLADLKESPPHDAPTPRGDTPCRRARSRP